MLKVRGLNFPVPCWINPAQSWPMPRFVSRTHERSDRGVAIGRSGAANEQRLCRILNPCPRRPCRSCAIGWFSGFGPRGWGNSRDLGWRARCASTEPESCRQPREDTAIARWRSCFGWAASASTARTAELPACGSFEQDASWTHRRRLAGIRDRGTTDRRRIHGSRFRP